MTAGESDKQKAEFELRRAEARLEAAQAAATLAELERQQYQELSPDARAELDRKQLECNALVTQAKVKAAECDVAIARLKLQESDQARVQAGIAKEDLKKAVAELEGAQATVAWTCENWKAQKTLADEGAGNRFVAEEAERDYQVALAGVKEAEVNLEEKRLAVAGYPKGQELG